MPPRGHKELASESEGRTPSSLRASHKQRNAVAQAAQQEFLAKHIHANSNEEKQKVHPLDFGAFDEKTLDRYSRKHGLEYPLAQTLNDDILHSEIGKKTHSYRKNSPYKIGKAELAHSLKMHFMALPCRENEIIASFLYTVKNQDKEFKLQFK